FILAYYVGVSFAGLIPYYILPIIPFLCLIAGYGIYNLYVKINKPAALAIIVLILILNFIPSLMWIYRLAQPSTTMMAREWIYDNIPSGSKIINFDIPLELNENKQAINDIKNFSSQFNKKRVYLSLMEEINYPKPNYYILYCSYYDVIPEELMKKKYDYLIVSFWNKIDFEEKQARLNDLKFKQKAALYKKFPEGADENNFSMNLANITNPIYNLLFKIRQSGPTIYIYKMD
ncbi:hypothetical protein HY797_00615, partial [Candidatus Falkowbacteria bacterium]|nr:hypothetical protein [Candidatus Falkowbacteria bacterium]